MTQSFSNGSKWLRADFHLHTKADKEFSYNCPEGESDTNGNFSKKYIDKLKEQGIELGVITNHNKFDVDEYKSIRRRGAKEEIFILPGVELSVPDGKSGIHCLLVFNDNWYDNKESKNYINTFLEVLFENIHNRENENAYCNFGLIDILKKLKEHQSKGRDSFIILAHVEEKSGFFEELGGNRITEISKDKFFKEFIIGFQKVRTHSAIQIWKQWFKESEFKIPAFVEGSDSKSLEELGIPHTQNFEGIDVQKKTYIKIGDNNFNAVKFSLKNYQIRISRDNRPENTHTFLESISFVGGKMDGETIMINSNLNCLIGLPGSGKSSILETIRFTLGFEISNADISRKKKSDITNWIYKEGLVSHFLQSGGKTIVTLRSKLGVKYTIERTLNENSIIKNDKGEELNINVIDIVDFLYFGQKDLTFQNKKNFQSRFIQRFIEKDLIPIEEKINRKKSVVISYLSKIGTLESIKEEKNNLEKRNDGLKEQLRLFSENKVDEKMKKQKKFEDDKNYIEKVIQQSESTINQSIDEFDIYLASIKKLVAPETLDNKNEITGTQLELEKISSVFEEAKAKLVLLNRRTENLSVEDKTLINKDNDGLEKMILYRDSLGEKAKTLKEEFEEIRREINIQSLDVDAYPLISREQKETKVKIDDLTLRLKDEEELRSSLNNAINDLRSAWINEEEFYKKTISRINSKELSIMVKLDEKRDATKFIEKLREIGKGSGITINKYESIASKFSDFFEIWTDLKNDEGTLNKILTEKEFFSFKNSIISEKNRILPFKIPLKLDLLYQGKSIEKHSDGQKASALILFTLSIGKKDLLIIDQPEDDLNSGDIYKEIVANLIKNKQQTQFLFATHDANIAVLGDTEKVICCEYFDNQIKINTGSIDKKESQLNIIKVIEGGADAFQERNKIYSMWNV